MGQFARFISQRTADHLTVHNGDPRRKRPRCYDPPGMSGSAKRIKTFIKRFSRSLGVEVRKRGSLESEHNRLVLLLAGRQADLVLDVGANTGQWAQELRRAGYAGDMISFEPLSSAHEQLARNARHDPRWTVAPRLALGNRNGQTEIHVSRNSYSSSILPIPRRDRPSSRC